MNIFIYERRRVFLMCFCFIDAILPKVCKTKFSNASYDTYKDAKQLFRLDALFCLYPKILRQFLVAYHQLAYRLAVYIDSFPILMLVDLLMFFDAYPPV